MSKKQAYQQKLEAQLNEWEAKIKELEAKASQVSADMKLEYQDQIQDLKAKQAAAKEKMREFGEASEDSWETLKNGMEGAWDRLGQAVRDASSRFRA